MEIITTHINADFDALASAVAAKKLYPGAEIVIPGSAEKAVREFIKKFEKKLGLLSEKKVDFEKVKRLIIVDTRQAGRLGRLGEFTRKRDVELHVYDHHSPHPGDLKGKIDVRRITGATVTILLEKIRKMKIVLSPFEATLMLLGLYQDTGGLIYPSTTAQDKAEARYLKSSGADLKIITGFLTRKLTREQTVLYRSLKKNKEIFFFAGAKVVIVAATAGRYIPDLARLTQRLMDEEKADVVLSLVGMQKHLHLVARSKTKKLNVERIVSFFGGGGHPTAAYARIQGIDLPEVKKTLLKILRQRIKESKPEKRSQPISAPNLSSTSISHKKRRNLSKLMKDKLPGPIMNRLEEIGIMGTEGGVSIYVVGGFVRDLLLGFPNYDLDIVVEGNAIAFASRLAEKWKAGVRKHKKFGTAVVYLPGGSKIDVATARTEYYHYPAAMPQVEGSSLKADLYRRDFTINAMAICLNKDEFGLLIDIFGGEADLKKKLVRCLHDLSFVEDPTRIFRAVRFEQRYAFKIDRHTQHLIRTAVNLDMFDWLANQRVLAELILILSEKEPLSAIKRMAEFNELRFIHPRIKLTKNLVSLFKKVKGVIVWMRDIFPEEEFAAWLIYLLALLDTLAKEEVREVAQKFVISKNNERQVILSKESGPRILSTLRKRRLKNSEIFCQLMGLPLEFLLLLSAKAGSNRVGKRIRFFIANLRRIRPLIRGTDLAKLGLKEGPVYKEVFRAVLWAKLDGRLKTKKEELSFVKKQKRLI